jgi:hypothetical protein
MVKKQIQPGPSGLASLRRPANSNFLPVIEELQQQPLPDGYLDYLHLKLRRLSLPARPDVQKNPFSDDR